MNRGSEDSILLSLLKTYRHVTPGRAEQVPESQGSGHISVNKPEMRSGTSSASESCESQPQETWVPWGAGAEEPRGLTPRGLTPRGLTPRGLTPGPCPRSPCRSPQLQHPCSSPFPNSLLPQFISAERLCRFKLLISANCLAVIKRSLSACHLPGSTSAAKAEPRARRSAAPQPGAGDPGLHSAR